MAKPIFGALALVCSICVAASGARSEETCGAEALQSLLNQPIEDVRAQLPDTARILPPDSVMTQDFRPDRLNVDLDAEGMITRFWCG